MREPAPVRQAVILAGGRGMRLRPLTDDRPKPMVEFHGRPFLEYIVEMLAAQRIDRVLLLLGYMPEVIQRHFGDGNRWGVRIDYGITDPEVLTAARVLAARDRLEARFLLLYCDNYWPMDLARMWQRYVAIGAPAMVTVYRNRDGWSRGHNIAVDADGLVTVFDRTRRTPGLEGVEIGYAILDRDLLDLLPAHDILIEEGLYPRLAAERRLAGYLTDHRYYSVGSLERLPSTDAFLARHPTLILDRDGVLNRRPPRASYVRTPDEVQWLPGARESIRRLTEAGYRLLVVSNQAGVARGAMSAADLRAVEGRILHDVEQAGGRIERFYDCLHDWDAGCDCRKPQPGLLFQAQRDFALDLSRTPFVGDDERDGQAAEAAGCPFRLVSDRVGLAEAMPELLGPDTALTPNTSLAPAARAERGSSGPAAAGAAQSHQQLGGDR